MDRIQKTSRFFRRLFMLTFFILPIFTVCYWINPSDFVGVNALMFPRGIIRPDILPAYARFAALLVDLIPMAKNLLILYFLIRLFRLFEQGQIFVDQGVAYIRNIGVVMLIYQVIYPFYELLISYVLTVWRPHHGKMIISFGTPQIFQIITAILIILIAWIFKEACHLREEQEYTV